MVAMKCYCQRSGYAFEQLGQAKIQKLKAKSCFYTLVTLHAFRGSGTLLSNVATSNKFSEMRSTVRFPLKLPIAVKTESEQHSAETENISAGGVLFQVDADMSVGSTIEFTISMPADVLGAPTDVMVNCVGRVVRCTDDGGRRVVAAVIDEYRFERA
jgi:hypothetical protein